MANAVTDPAVLSAFSGGGGEEAPAGPAPVTDPTVLGQFGNDGPAAVPGQHPNSTPSLPMDELPFGDQASLSQMSNINEYSLYLSHRYGKDNVVHDWDSEGNPNLIVSAQDGKKYRIGPPGGKEGGPSFVAKLAGETPKIVGAALGGAAGAVVAGPPGMVAGAALGGMAGQSYINGVKAVTGNYDETTAEGVSSLGIGAVEGASQEMGGAIAGKVISKATQFRLPKFITGATDESIRMTKAAHASGALPSYRSMAPGLTHLQRIEVLDEKLSGRNLKADELNLGYTKMHLRTMLGDNGYPREHVEELLRDLDNPEQAVSNSHVGDMLKESVDAHTKALTDSIAEQGTQADAHIGAQIENLNKQIDKSKSGDLSGDFATAYESAHADFTKTATNMYAQMDKLLGGRKVVPVDQVSAAAKKIVEQIKEASPTQVQALQKELSQRMGKEMSADDAVLMHEFGIEIPADNGKITLQAAQRLRTVLRQKAGSGQLMHNATQHDYGELASAIDESIHAAGSDPAASKAIKALDDADRFWKTNIKKFDDAKTNNLIKQIKAGAGPDPDKLVQMIAGKGSSSRITRIRNTVGPEMWSKVQSGHMLQYLQKFGVRQADGKTAIDGIKMLNDLDNGDQGLALKAIHGPDAVGNLREIAKMVATRRGELDPAVLRTGDVKTALVQMKQREAVLGQWMEKNWVKELSDPNKTGDQAYQWLARGHDNGGQEQRIMQVVAHFGKDSPQVMGLRQAMLEEITRNANVNTIMSRGNGALDEAMSQYTKGQLNAVFPATFARDMHSISKVIKFMFPVESGAAKDTSMASMEAGAIQSHHTPTLKRLYSIAVASVMRQIVMHPNIAKFLVTGREEGEQAWQRATAKWIKQVSGSLSEVADATITANNAAQPAQRPGQGAQPMPGPQTMQ